MISGFYNDLFLKTKNNEKTTTKQSSEITKNKQSFIHTIPKECLYMILIFCDIKDLQHLLFVNKFLNIVSRDEKIWKEQFNKLIKNWESPSQINFAKNTTFRMNTLKVKYLDKFYNNYINSFFGKKASLIKAAELGHPLATLRLGMSNKYIDESMKLFEKAFQLCQLTPFCNATFNYSKEIASEIYILAGKTTRNEEHHLIAFDFNNAINMYGLILNFSADIKDSGILNRVFIELKFLQSKMEKKIEGNIGDILGDYLALGDMKRERKKQWQPLVKKCKRLIKLYNTLQENAQLDVKTGFSK